MIVDQPRAHFIFGYHPDVYKGYQYVAYQGKTLTNKEYLEHWGKWIVLGPKSKHDNLAKKLDTYVESGLIACFKYDRQPLTHLGLHECIMSVFCDDRNRDRVWTILAEQGERLKAWIHDRETVNMWLPGGRLLENWIRSENMDEFEAEGVRADSRNKFSRILDHPDKPFAGWPQ
jgi:hypothetical protein